MERAGVSLCNLSAINLLNNEDNWLHGEYMGPKITDTFTGQFHIMFSQRQSLKYYLTAIEDNVWVRCLIKDY